VARAVLQRAVRVPDEALRRELITAFLAFDAHRIVRLEQLRIEHASALAEALVIHFELDDRLLLVLAFAARLLVEAVLRLANLCGIARLGAQEQRAHEPLGVGLRDETAGRRVPRQDARVLELVELIAGAAGAVDLQLVAHLIDLLQREVLQHRVQYLRQT